MASSVCSGAAAFPTPPHEKLLSRKPPTLDAFFQADALLRMGYVQTPTERDILVGMGVGANTGTRRYHEKIEESRSAFWLARSTKKLVEEIRIQMTEEGRRFLRLHTGSDRCFEVSRNAARKQIAQDLRDSSMRDVTERKSNKRNNPVNYSVNGGDGSSKKSTGKDSLSQSTSTDVALEQPSAKRTKYDTEVGSVARSATSAYTDDSPYCYSDGTMPNFRPLPSYPTMFPYDIPTGGSNHGWRSHGSGSTLASQDFDLSCIAHLMEPMITVDYTSNNLEPLSLQDFESASVQAKAMSSPPSCSTLASLTNNESDLEDVMNQPIVEIEVSPVAAMPGKKLVGKDDAVQAPKDIPSIGSDSRLVWEAQSMNLLQPPQVTPIGKNNYNYTSALDADVDAIELDQTLGYLPVQNSSNAGKNTASSAWL